MSRYPSQRQVVPYFPASGSKRRPVSTAARRARHMRQRDSRLGVAWGGPPEAGFLRPLPTWFKTRATRVISVPLPDVTLGNFRLTKGNPTAAGNPSMARPYGGSMSLACHGAAPWPRPSRLLLVPIVPRVQSRSLVWREANTPPVSVVLERWVSRRSNPSYAYDFSRSRGVDRPEVCIFCLSLPET